ncbi:MAG TPA: hypothetical protein DD979_16605 [Gammaproteobacteria bacterium]|jgi:uncharacterized OB-fold protein|nr:hypothetical protein [Gammaproteobacteria bacterium]
MTVINEQTHDSDLPLLNTPIISLGGEGIRIRGGHCESCGQLHYPYCTHCMRCGQQVSPVYFDPAGKVYSFTTVQTKAPYGLPEPYTVGYIELNENGLRVFGLFAPEVSGDIEIGTEVVISLQALGLDGQQQPCLRPVFTVANDKEST